MVKFSSPLAAQMFKAKFQDQTYAVYVWQNRAEFDQKTSPADVNAPLVGHYFDEEHVLKLPEQDPVTCYLYDEPGQEIFVVAKKGETVHLAIVGNTPQFIDLPAFQENRAFPQLFLKIKHITKFHDPNEGFNIHFYNPLAMTNETIMIKKIFVREALGQSTSSSSMDMVAAPQNADAKMDVFPWLDENDGNYKPITMPVVTWKDADASQHSELELSMHDFAGTDSHMGHLYKDGTFRVAQQSSTYRWLFNVYCYTAWLCLRDGLTFIVANHRNKAIVLVRGKDSPITLPHQPISHLGMSRVIRSVSIEEDHEKKDSFDVTFMRGVSEEYSIHGLIEQQTFNQKRHIRMEGTGRWTGTYLLNQAHNVTANVWSEVDLAQSLDRNKGNEESGEAIKNADLSMHLNCYPLNRVIKMAIEVIGESGLGRFAHTQLQGTYSETHRAIIAVTPVIILDFSKTVDQARVTQIKDKIIRLLRVPNDVEDIITQLDKLVHEIASHFVMHAPADSDPFELMLKYDVVNRIMDAINPKSAESLGRKNVWRTIYFDIIFAIPFAKYLYVMLENNDVPKRNCQIRVPDGYEKIDFSNREVSITYKDKEISHTFAELVNYSIRVFTEAHYSRTIVLEPSINFNHRTFRKWIVVFWNNLDVNQDFFLPEFDEKCRTEHAASLDIPAEEIDIVHFYLKPNILRCTEHENHRLLVNTRGCFIDLGSKSMFIFGHHYSLQFVYCDHEEKRQYLHEKSCEDFSGFDWKKDQIEHVDYDNASDSVRVHYLDFEKTIAEEKRATSIITYPFDKLATDCKNDGKNNKPKRQ